MPPRACTISGWILGTAATIKVFIDIFIGIWAFVLGYIWTNHINVTPASNKAKAREIWQRFPNLVVTFILFGFISRSTLADVAKNVPAAIGVANTFRVIFYPHLLLDRRAVELPRAVAEGFETRRGLLSACSASWSGSAC